MGVVGKGAGWGGWLQIELTQLLLVCEVSCAVYRASASAHVLVSCCCMLCEMHLHFVQNFRLFERAFERQLIRMLVSVRMLVYVC